MLSHPPTILITGCNRGIGLALTLSLLHKNPHTHILATTRTNKQQLQTKLTQKTNNNNLTIIELDLTSKKNIDELVAELTARNIYLDAIVNNGGVYLDDGPPKYDPEDSKVSQEQRDQIHKLMAEAALQTIRTNFYGVVMLTQSLLPFLKDKGRVISVSSRYGALKLNGPSVREFFSNPDINIGEIDLEVNKYIQGCRKGDTGEYFKSPYGVSKMMLNCWSRFILRKKLKPTQQAIVMSPGYCQTDMSPQGVRSAQDGAQSIYTLLQGEYCSQIFYNYDGKSDYFNCGLQEQQKI